LYTSYCTDRKYFCRFSCTPGN